MPSGGSSRRAAAFLYAALVLDPTASTLQFHGVASLHSFDADVKELSGVATTASSEAGELTTAHGSLRWPARSIDTHIDRRNDEMFKLLEPQKYPEMTFTLKVAKPLPNVTDDGRVIEDLSSGETKCALSGELALHGHSGPIEGKGHCARHADGSWLVEGEAPVDMTAYGITPPRIAFITMDQVVTVRYKLSFKPH